MQLQLHDIIHLCILRVFVLLFAPCAVHLNLLLHAYMRPSVYALVSYIIVLHIHHAATIHDSFIRGCNMLCWRCQSWRPGHAVFCIPDTRKPFAKLDSESIPVTFRSSKHQHQPTPKVICLHWEHLKTTTTGSVVPLKRISQYKSNGKTNESSTLETFKKTTTFQWEKNITNHITNHLTI